MSKFLESSPNTIYVSKQEAEASVMSYRLDITCPKQHHIAAELDSQEVWCNKCNKMYVVINDWM